jgi:hypothetical protein
VRTVAKVFIPCAVLVLVAACAAYNPIRQAETSQQKALAAYGSVTILVEQIANLLEPDTLPDNVQERLIQAAEVGGRTAVTGLNVYLEAEAARVAFEADAAQSGRLTAALTNLDTWVTRADAVIADLKTTIRGAQ